jgi:hypothetical protein
MKKFCLLLFSLVTLLSCSTDSTNQTTTNPNLLQRIDFYPGLIIERRWIFNADGLLKEITKSDGTIVQDFTYDNNNRLINSTVFNNNSTSQTYIFTYDNNGFVNSVNGETVNYSSSLDACYTGNLSQSYRLTKINSNNLLVQGINAYQDTDDNGNPIEIINDYIYVGYSNNNNIMNYSRNEGCNSFTYDNNSNPIRNATLAICRAFSFTENSTWVNGQYNSTNNPISLNFCSVDPESHIYHYTYNSNNLPSTQTRDDYYLGVYENTIPSAKYYYQGDVIP